MMMGFKVEPIEETKYYGFEIDGNHRFLLGDFTVTHNTITSINLACTIKLKTLIVVNKVVLIKQWKESIEMFCKNPRIQILESKSDFDEEADFYIMNAINISKMGHSFFKHIKLLIIDELHNIMAEQLSYSMNYIQPRYLIGLSATPYRNDGLDILIDIYFGNNKIVRELYHEHRVFLIKTNFKPEVKVMDNGRVNFSSILKDLSESDERNEIIIDILRRHKDRNFLVIIKRIKQGEYLLKRLQEEGESVDSLIGSKQKFDKEARILIGTSSKIGTGFDHKKLDTLMLAAPVKEYFIQFLGRVFRRKDVKPYVFDLLDNNPILLRHYKDRKEIYNKHGGRVTIYDETVLI